MTMPLSHGVLRRAAQVDVDHILNKLLSSHGGGSGQSLILAVGDTSGAQPASPCDFSFLWCLKCSTSPAPHLQGDSAETEDDIGLLHLPDVVGS